MEGQPELVPVLEAHRIDEGRLADCLGREDLLDGPLKVRQFQGGQSNPTYLLESGERRYVLRKKPPGKVLPSAHQVDREFRVMKALGEHSDVPVPRMRLFSDDEDVVGTSFYVMDFVPGRVYSHPQLEALPKEQRADLYHSSVDTLAKLHRVDYQAAGLGDFGRPQGYVARQVKRWSAQYQASQTDQLPAMDNLIDWLQEHIPAEDSAAIAHGDNRLARKLGAAELLERVDHVRPRGARHELQQIVQVPKQATVPGHADGAYRITRKAPLLQGWHDTRQGVAHRTSQRAAAGRGSNRERLPVLVQQFALGWERIGGAATHAE